MTLTLGGERIASPRYSENVAGLIPGSLVGETFLIGKGLKFHPCRFEESFQQLERLMSTVAQQLTRDSFIIIVEDYDILHEQDTKLK